MTFGRTRKESRNLAGLFWQISWVEWASMATMPDLEPETAAINVGEFIAALITCETFTDFCTDRITTLQLDNTTAKAWIDTARCTRAPFDRCAQGIHLHLLKKNMKVRTSWIPSAENLVADTCSRVSLTWNVPKHVHTIAGQRFRRLSPKFNNLLRFLS